MYGKRVTPADEGSFGRTLLIALAITLGVVAAAMGGMGIYANHIYEGMLPGVSIDGLPLNGLSEEEARTALTARLTEKLAGETITVTAGGRPIGTLDLLTLGAGYDLDAALSEAAAMGKGGGVTGWLGNAAAMTGAIFGRDHDITPLRTFDETTLRAAVAELAKGFDKECTDATYELTPEGIFAIKETTGRTLDQEALVAALPTAVGSVDAAYTKTPAKGLDVWAMAEELTAEALPARYDISLGKVVEGQVGVAMDPEAAQYVLDAAAEGERVQLPAQVIYPEKTAAELQAVLFRDLLSSATTNVSGSTSRKGNVQRSGELVNGTILNPGDVFDYNKVVGPRTEERGFGYGGSYVNGQTVDVIGGGICQTSSTIYYASLLADLEIVTRVNHRFYPGYIPKGMDATVSWGGPDFRFRNDTDYPIRLEVVYENSTITVNIYGTKVDDTYVVMSSEVISTTPYTTEYQETSDLPYGQERQKQSGYTGYVVESYRNIYSGDGTLLSSTLESKNTYRSRNVIILVGTAGKPASNTGSTGDATAPDEPELPPEEEPSLPPG